MCSHQTTQALSGPRSILFGEHFLDRLDANGPDDDSCSDPFAEFVEEHTKSVSLLLRLSCVSGYRGFVGFIPKDAEWYLADLVMQITVEGDARNVVHTNLRLIRADSPEEAYEEALKLGAASEHSYANPDGNFVRIRFRGLGSLNVIHEKLEHGAEVSYVEERDLSEETIAERLTPQEQLGVFRPIGVSSGLDYMSRDIQDKMRAERPEWFDEDGHRLF